MSRARTSIRRMYAYGAATVSPLSCLIVYRMRKTAARDYPAVMTSPKGHVVTYLPKPVLVIPDNPAARAAMVDRVVKKADARGTPINRFHCRVRAGNRSHAMTYTYTIATWDPDNTIRTLEEALHRLTAESGGRVVAMTLDPSSLPRNGARLLIVIETANP